MATMQYLPLDLQNWVIFKMEAVVAAAGKK